MKTTVLSVMAALSLVFSLSACSSLQKSSAQKPVNASAPVAQEQQNDQPNIGNGMNDVSTTMPVRRPVIMLDSLNLMKISGQWTLRSINGVTLSAEKGDSEDNRPYINFNALDARFYASDGCNTLNGDFRVTQDYKLELVNPTSTMRLCPDAPYERPFREALNETAKFSIEQKNDENILSLYNSKGTLLMTLVRPMTDFLNGSWKVTEINGKPVDNPNVTMVIDLPEMKVHGRTGCNTFNGSIFVDPDQDGSLQFQQVGVTRMLCPDMETESAFLVALESVQFAKASATGAVLTDSQHQPVLTLVPLQLKED